MNYLNPIYTEKRECQDCYKCLRNCPVKAIKVEGGYAMIMPENCMVCGRCVEICPNGAKVVRDDLPRVREMLGSGRRVIASLAPSFVSEFPDIRPGQLIAAIKRLGFEAVSETALGAQEVSAAVAGMLQTPSRSVYISSACPTVVAFLQKHRPSATPLITSVLSPLLTHCKMLRQKFSNSGIVFFGPCIAKKLEADAHPDLLNAALTFEDLRRWLQSEHITPADLHEGAEDAFVPERSAEGAWYPIDGGMIAGIKRNCSVNDGSFMSFSGIQAVQKALAGLDDLIQSADRSHPVFLELLACEGGCVNGPKLSRKAATVAKRLQVLRNGKYAARASGGGLGIDFDFATQPKSAPVFPESQIREALRTVGKESAEDELNCGGCGYENCREFARALIQHNAERTMCITYMRQLAQKKANALIQKIPSAVVIVDNSLRVIEFNPVFAQLFATVNGDSESPQHKMVPFQNLFAQVLKSGQDMVDKDLRFRDTILHLSIFSIEKHRIAGGIIQDVTVPAVQKEQVIRKAREVIQHNLATVQKIAYLLGENASESEITLNSIIDSVSMPQLAEEDQKSQPGGPDL